MSPPSPKETPIMYQKNTNKRCPGIYMYFVHIPVDLELKQGVFKHGCCSLIGGAFIISLLIK